MPPDAAPYAYAFDAARSAALLREPPGAVRRVPEALVQDLWQQQRFDRSGLVTTQGAPVTVLHPGRLNTDGGPDFREARLRIGAVEWRGDVEIHLTSAGWNEHGHNADPRYNSTVLHVTLEADGFTGRLRREDGSRLPECVLEGCLDTPLRALLYDFLRRPEGGILCAAHWPGVPEALRRRWVAEMAAERLREKQKRLAERFLEVPNLDALLHEAVFRGLGYAKNAEAMADLARRVPLQLARALPDARDREALHLGAAGLLPTPADLPEDDRRTADYAMDLRRRFEHLQKKHAIAPMEPTRWQRFRLRPANFPPLRIAQGAALFQSGGILHHDALGTSLHALRAEAPLKALRQAFAAPPPVFWKTHLRLVKATKPRDPSIGRSRTDTLIVNAVLPVLLLHAEQRSKEHLEARVFDLLRRLPAASDRVTRRFRDLGTHPRHAFEGQGLHQLYRTRCAEAACLACAVGQFLLK